MHEQSIGLLNQALADELAAIHQYMYFHFHCDDQGFGLLARLFRQTAITEMTHAERLAERILFLGGDVEMVPAAEVQNIRDAAGMLAHARSMEEAAVKMYNASARKCADHGDSASKQVFEALIVEEERHYDSYSTQAEHLQKFGDSYLALQAMEGSPSGEETA